MKDLPGLLSLVAFEAAARHTSFKLAAEELCITPSAVSHRIRVLEEQLGLALFHRYNRQLALTDRGATYYESVQEAFGAIAHSTRALKTSGSVETLLIQSPPGLASKWLMPRLARFIEMHPNIRVKLNAVEQKANFQRRAVDLAICHLPPNEPDLRAEVLLSEQFLPLCSPQYLRGPEQQLSDMTLIETERNPVTWAMWLESHEVAGVDLRKALQIDPSSMAIEAAVQGLGVVLESDLLARQEIDAGLLVNPLRSESRQPMTRQYYLVCARSRENEPSIAAFSGWLRGLAQAST